MHTETLMQVALFLVAPFLAVVLISLVVLLAIRGGKPFNFKASGFGVAIGFSSNDPEPEPATEDTAP